MVKQALIQASHGVTPALALLLWECGERMTEDITFIPGWIPGRRADVACAHGR